MSDLRRYLFSLTAAALLCSLVRALVPDGRMKRICTLFCGIFLAMTALSGLAGWELTDVAEQLSKIQMEAEQARTGVEIKNREALCAIIKSKTEAYILDKAAALGCTITAEVTVENSGAYPYPSGVRIAGTFTPQQQQALSEDLEENLAIGKEQQMWSSE